MGSFMQVYTDGGGIREARVPDDYSGNGSQPFILKFPGFRRSLLASLVASSTASRTSNVVTIAATAHGITTGSTYVGFRFFYPGSPSLAAGWYDSITDVQTNSISFNSIGANFSSESVNGGVAYTTLTAFTSITFLEDSLTLGSQLTLKILRGGDVTAATKAIRGLLDSQLYGLANATTGPHGILQITISVENGGSINSARITSPLGTDGSVWNSAASASFDLSQTHAYSVQGSISAAGGFLTLLNCSLEVVK